MLLTLPKLAYARDSLEPHMSRETLDFHYDKHHRKYVDTGNELITGTEFETMPIEDVIRKSSGKIFNNVAQAWNHGFFWNCLTPKQESPSGSFDDMLTQNFGGNNQFRELFNETAADTFGSGWTWLVMDTQGDLKVVNTHNAGNPLTAHQTPLLACDVWEHAYYIDYRNDRAEFLKHYWNLVDWAFVETNLWEALNSAAA